MVDNVIVFNSVESYHGEKYVPMSGAQWESVMPPTVMSMSPLWSASRMSGAQLRRLRSSTVIGSSTASTMMPTRW